MAHSLSPECTPLKHAYDSCFNAWFAGYLEPTLTVHEQREKDKNPRDYQKRKAEEFQQNCGKVWESYRECVQKAIKNKGLTEVLDQAREENPLREPPPPLDIPSHGGSSQNSK
ncbi:hypothetical protein BJ322DRAFT_1019132 [Thelephora terrestris]|uniref:Uncharacterized protein n=1 Tax=Thelephora terrestris TaxID=56493 RepID=A0A9P6HK50_9AGAM|nr:hypothetical protein BJ322DRAFT_1019132 [Thelephora terrestris]